MSIVVGPPRGSEWRRRLRPIRVFCLEAALIVFGAWAIGWMYGLAFAALSFPFVLLSEVVLANTVWFENHTPQLTKFRVVPVVVLWLICVLPITPHLGRWLYQQAGIEPPDNRYVRSIDIEGGIMVEFGARYVPIPGVRVGIELDAKEATRDCAFSGPLQTDSENIQWEGACYGRGGRDDDGMWWHVPAGNLPITTKKSLYMRFSKEPAPQLISCTVASNSESDGKKCYQGVDVLN